MTGLHDPVRGPLESKADYHARLRHSRTAARRETARATIPAPRSAGGRGRKARRPIRDSGQHPKFPAERKRRRPPGVPLFGRRARLRIIR